MSVAEPKNSSKLRASITLLVAIAIWSLPPPVGVEPRAWRLFAIFAATIIGLILQPMPMGAIVFFGITVAAVTGTLSINEALNGYQDSTVWLIVGAFLFARAFSRSGLGLRVAYVFIRGFGRRTIGLAYALGLADLVLAPGIPSGAARTGGVVFPVVKGLASAYGSEPGPTADRIGRYLVLSTYQVHSVTCAMFMTSMVANPLIVELTQKTVGVEITWGDWAIAALVPGVISLVVLPYVILLLTRPAIRKTPDAAEFARDELARMGAMSRDERIVALVFLLAFMLWVTGSITHINPTVVALLGASLMLGFGAITWQDVLGERAAWDALIWFGGLVGMATMLSKLGLLAWFSGHVGLYVTGWRWPLALTALVFVYIYSHYLFASLAAHTTAFFVPFLSVAVAAGAPAHMAALAFAFSSSLCVSLTHYGGGPSPVYWGSGYADVRQWWSVGFVTSLLHILIWVGIGPFWWRILGLF